MHQQASVTTQRLAWDVEDVMFISTQLRGIINISRAISLAATNATLLAKRAETRAVGFEVVSRDLRDFSLKIDELVRVLAEETQGIAQEVAVLSESSRFMTYLCQVNTDKVVIQEAIHRRESLESDTQIRLMERVSKLLILIGKAERLCATGDMLTRLGLIEAVDGGMMRSSLQLVSSEVAESIARILVMIKVMQARLTNKTLP